MVRGSQRDLQGKIGESRETTRIPQSLIDLLHVAHVFHFSGLLSDGADTFAVATPIVTGHLSISVFGLRLDVHLYVSDRGFLLSQLAFFLVQSQRCVP